MSECVVPGRVHSADRVLVYAGRSSGPPDWTPEPYLMCGMHAQGDLTDTFKAIHRKDGGFVGPLLLIAAVLILLITVIGLAVSNPVALVISVAVVAAVCWRIRVGLSRFLGGR